MFYEQVILSLYIKLMKVEKPLLRRNHLLSLLEVVH
jgi:hypothetical protein